MFKKELTRDKVKEIVTKIDEKVKAGLNQGGITINNVVTFVIEVWTGQITSILQERNKNKIVTECLISDLVRGKVMYYNVDELIEAVEITEELCKLKGYEILEFQNRLWKP